MDHRQLEDRLAGLLSGLGGAVRRDPHVREDLRTLLRHGRLYTSALSEATQRAVEGQIATAIREMTEPCPLTTSGYRLLARVLLATLLRRFRPELLITTPRRSVKTGRRSRH